MVATRIHVSEKNIDWAFKETDLNTSNINRIVEKSIWLQSDNDKYLNPTIKQLSDFATKLHVPFANLLLDKIPKQENIQLAFRTQENAPAKVSLNVRAIIYEMKRKQAWFKEESGYANSELRFIGVADARNQTETKVLKELEKLVILKHFSSSRELFNNLRNQLAHQGILVMQKGGVGNGTNRPLNVEEMRAFVLLDEYAPLIFINQKDSYTARIFSLIHEVVHILRGTDELFINLNETLQEERMINNVVASFLMPEEKFRKLFKSVELNKVANYFNVSPFAAAIRAKSLNLTDNIEEYTQFDMEPMMIKKGNGGSPYNTALSYNDNRYMAALVDSQRNGTLPPTKAASLLGISTKMLEKTMNLFSEREVRI